MSRAVLVRAALLAAALGAGCGRFGFADRTDAAAAAAEGPMGAMADGAPDAAPPPLGPMTMPEGGEIVAIPQMFAGVDRYVVTSRGPYRSTDGTSWTACAAASGSAMATLATGEIWLAGSDDVYESSDSCATWTPLSVGCTPVDVAVASSQIFAMCTDKLRVRPQTLGSWSTVTTPLAGDTLQSFATSSDGTVMLIGSSRNGLLRSTDHGATWSAITAGLDTLDIAELAIAPTDSTHAYAMEASYNDNVADIVCSTDGGVTWAQCFPEGGTSIAVSPTSATSLLASPYDTLLGTSDAFAHVTSDLRTVGTNLDAARVLAVAYTPTGTYLIGSERGLYEATPSPTPAWQAHNTGLSAWTINDLQIANGHIYAGTAAGALVSTDGVGFTVSTVGDHTNTFAFHVLPVGGTLLEAGSQIRTSADDGQTWTLAYTAGDADDGFVVSLAAIGTHVIAGTDGEVVVADPPYTSWTPSVVGVAGRQVSALAVRGSDVFAGTDGGVYVSHDGGASWTNVAAVSGVFTHLAVTADGRVVAGSTARLWISDVTATTWSQTSIADSISGLATSGDAIVEGGSQGVRVSHDGGATWTAVPGLPAATTSALAFDPQGDLLVGTRGFGVVRLAPP